MGKKTTKVQWNSERVKALRTHLGATQHDLADQMGIRQQTVSEWETGMYCPRGTSNTLLNILAERSEFKYRVKKSKNDPKQA